MKSFEEHIEKREDHSKDTKLDLFVNRDSKVQVNINFEGKQYSITKNGRGLKISSIQGVKIETMDDEQGQWLAVI